MNAYLTYDRIEDRRWVEQQLTDEKEKWIDDRAKELIAMFPAKPLEMSSLFLPQERTLPGTRRWFFCWHCGCNSLTNPAHNRYCHAIPEMGWR